MKPANLNWFFVLLLLVFSACRPSYEPDESATVFRSVLDERPRMITMKLDDALWTAYSAETGALYRVWRDGVDFSGAVYTTAHGPQPTSEGPAYLVTNTPSPWMIRQAGVSAAPQVRYKGHAERDGQQSIQVELRATDGATMLVTEAPSFVTDNDGNPGMERVFTVENAPANAEVMLAVTLNSLLNDRSFSTNGGFEVSEQEDGSLSGWLTLRNGESTTFTSYFGEPAVVRPQEEGPAKPYGLQLIEGSDCAACHNAEVQTVGPSYVAIAERYPKDDLTVVRLAGKIISGGSGVWGEVLMTPHPTLEQEDAKRMVEYILSLGGAENTSGGPLDVPGDIYPLTEQRDGSNGLAVNMYAITNSPNSLETLELSDAPYYSGIVPALHAPNEGYMGDVRINFFVSVTGFITIEESDNYVFRLVADDGARFYLGDRMLIDHDGLHGPEPRDSELLLDAGTYPIRVDFFQAGGGAALSLQWAKRGDDGFSVIPNEVLTYSQDDLKEAVEYAVLTGNDDKRPGDQMALKDVHPSFAVETIRPDSFEPMVGGLDVMDDGRVVVSTWDGEGGVYLVSNINQPNRDQIEVKQIARGLAEPLGVKVVDGEVYVLQKQELTRLVDEDGDDVADVYATVANDWGATGNFHEFAFGLVYKDNHFYATLATAILPGGASADPQDPDRGTVVKINKDTGDVEFIAKGLRTPNGIGLGINDEIFVADNQGDWLPASKVVHIVEGEFYGSRSVDFEGTAGLTEKKPVSWLPQDEIGNSPSQPAILNVGPYQNQMIHGEVTHGGIKRVFVEEIDGQLQGALFRFTQGLEAGVNRLVWGPDEKLYIGGIGNPGNWGHVGKTWFGLQRMTYTGNPVFEMLAIRAASDGFEIEFTEPLADGVGEQAADYNITQFYYLPTAEYGGPKRSERSLPMEKIEVSDDRKRVKLTLGGLQPDHMVYFRLNDETFSSEAGRSLWTTEAWYTLNRIP
ncbi:MAG: PA14 domain-containing protein [Bacteroidota bacterium]